MLTDTKDTQLMWKQSHVLNTQLMWKLPHVLTYMSSSCGSSAIISMTSDIRTASLNPSPYTQTQDSGVQAAFYGNIIILEYHISLFMYYFLHNHLSSTFLLRSTTDSPSNYHCHYCLLFTFLLQHSQNLLFS